MLPTRPDITVSPGVYPPSEDSDLLLLSMTVKPGECVLDMGAGSGILAIEAARAGGVVTAADISQAAVECTRENARNNGVEVKVVRSDLFSHPDLAGRFDVILFNPPYLPTEEWSTARPGREADAGEPLDDRREPPMRRGEGYGERKRHEDGRARNREAHRGPGLDDDRVWDGGGDGSEVMERFLRVVPEHLGEGGRCYLLFSSLTGGGPRGIQELIRDILVFRLVGEMPLFFERLYVYELHHPAAPPG